MTKHATKQRGATKHGTGKPVRVLIDYSQMEHPEDSSDPGLCRETPLPPWHARNRSERRWMIDWVIGRWSMLPDPPQRVSSDADGNKFIAWWYDGCGREIEAAEHGDIEPLRKKFPHIARFLNLPVLPNKKNWPKRKTYARDESAAAIMRDVKAIWRQYYGRTTRPQGSVGMAEIAAEILNAKTSVIREGRRLLWQERARRKKAAPAGTG